MCYHPTPVRTLIFFLVVISATAHAGCGGIIAEAYERRVRRQLPQVSKSPLIQRLIQMQVDKRIEGDLAWSTFYPFWIFRDSEALELIIASLPGGEDLGLELQSREFNDLETLLDVWETAYEENGGRISSLWTFEGAQRFRRRYYLELASRYMKLEGGLNAEGQPQALTRKENAPLGYSQSYAVLMNIFPDGKRSLDRCYLDYVRHQQRIRTPRGDRSTTPAIQSAFNGLSKATGSSRSRLRVGDGPDRASDLKNRKKEEILDVATARLLATRPRSALPLVSFMYDSTSTMGYSHFQLLFSEYEALSKVFGGFSQFVEALNGRLVANGEEPIQLTRGENWAQEILIEAGIAHVLQGDVVDADSFNQNAQVYRDCKTPAVFLVRKILAFADTWVDVAQD